MAEAPAVKEEAPKEPEAPKAKPTDPWADCDKFTMDMDAWKRFYSNNDEDKSIEHFWAEAVRYFTYFLNI